MSAVRILIVDDEINLLSSLKDALIGVDSSWQIFTAASAEAALEILEREPIDLAVCDIRMPGLDGLSLLQHAREHHPNLRLIMMTAYGSEQMRRVTIERGAVGYLEKPFELDDFVGLVQEYVRPQGFRGIGVAGFRLEDFFQLVEMSSITSGVRIRSGDREGRIFFKSGQPLHAETDSGLSGEEAFYDIITWDAGDLASFTLPAEGVEPTIHASLMHLMMDGMRHLDEGGLGEWEGSDVLLDELDGWDMRDEGEPGAESSAPPSLGDDGRQITETFEADELAQTVRVDAESAPLLEEIPRPSSLDEHTSPSQVDASEDAPAQKAVDLGAASDAPYSESSPTPPREDAHADDLAAQEDTPRRSQMDRQGLMRALEEMSEEMMGGLIATDVWKTDTAMAIAGINTQPKAVALFNRVSEMITRTMVGAENSFATGIAQYMIQTEDGLFVFVVELGDGYRWGMLVDGSKAPVGLMLSVIIPETLANIRAALAA